MIDVKQKIHIDVVALYDLAYQNDLPEICGALSNVEHLLWKLRRREDKENHCGLTQQEADDQSYFENLQECLNQEKGVSA
jgi:hypothetical protein